MAESGCSSLVERNRFKFVSDYLLFFFKEKIYYCCFAVRIRTFNPYQD